MELDNGINLCNEFFCTLYDGIVNRVRKMEIHAKNSQHT